MKKNIIKTKTALVLGIIFIILIISAIYYFFDTKYQKEYENFPTLSIVMQDGSEVEMLPIEYEWTYNGNTRTYKLDEDFKSYDYPKEHTIYRSTNEKKIYNIKSNVKYKSDSFSDNVYRVTNGIVQEVSGGNGSGDLSKSLKKGDMSLQPANSVGEYVESIKINYKNQGYVVYAIKSICFDDEINEISNYQNLDLTNTEKIKELVGKLKYNEFFKDINIEGNTINLKYDYYINSDALYMSNMILFASIPNLDKIVYTAENKKTFYYDNENKQEVDTEMENKTFLRSDYEKSSFNIETLLKLVNIGV